MLRGLGSWLGLDPEPDTESAEEKEQQRAAEQEVVTEQRGEDKRVCVQPEEEEAPPHDEPEDVLVKQAKGFGNYLLNFASVATKKLSESVAETAHNIKKSVEEGKIDGIIEKTIIGDFQKEQEKFVHEKNVKKTDFIFHAHGRNRGSDCLVSERQILKSKDRSERILNTLFLGRKPVT